MLATPQNKNATALWPADQIERWPIERLVPYARNARTHTPGQIDQIAASIREWGWTIPVLVVGGRTVRSTRLLGGSADPSSSRPSLRSHCTAMLTGLRTLIQAGCRPDRYGASIRLDTMPS